jgi:hypothetical protein
MHYEDKDIPALRVLVTYKSHLHDPPLEWSPKFVVHLLDESSEIRADVQNQVARELYDRLMPGKTYIISGFHYRTYSKLSRKFWPNLRNTHYLWLGKTTVIEEVRIQLLRNI